MLPYSVVLFIPWSTACQESESHKWRLADTLATDTAKWLSLKSLLTGQKVPANSQLWTWGEASLFRLLMQLVIRSQGKMFLQVLASISAGHFLNITSCKSHSQPSLAKLERQKTSLAEQECSLGNKAKTEGACPEETRSSNIGRTERCCFPQQGEKSCSQKSAGVDIARTVGNSKKSSFQKN